MELRIVRQRVDGELGDGEEGFGVFQRGDGGAKRGKIGLGQLDQPIVTHPVREIGFLEGSVPLEPGARFIDLLVGEKSFHPWRKPGDGRAFLAKRFERRESARRIAGLLLQVDRLHHFVFGTGHLPLHVGDRRQHRVAAAVERAEKESEIDVNEDNEADRAETQLLDLVLG